MNKRNDHSFAAETGLRIGQRVELHPAMDAWMQGDRYGEVRGWQGYRVLVLMDRSGHTLKVYPDNLTILT